MMPKYIFYFNLSGFFNHKCFENEDEKILQLMDLTQIILDYHRLNCDTISLISRLFRNYTTKRFVIFIILLNTIFDWERKLFWKKNRIEYCVHDVIKYCINLEYLLKIGGSEGFFGNCNLQILQIQDRVDFLVFRHLSWWDILIWVMSSSKVFESNIFTCGGKKVKALLWKILPFWTINFQIIFSWWRLVFISM